MKKKIKKNPNYVNNLTLTLVNNDTKEVLEKKYLFIKNKDLFRLQSRINRSLVRYYYDICSYLP